MISKNTNKNGVKLLAAIAVVAIALVGMAVVPAIPSSEGKTNDWDHAAHDLSKDDGWQVAFTYNTFMKERVQQTGEQISDYTSVTYDGGIYKVKGVVSGLQVLGNATSITGENDASYSPSNASNDWDSDYRMFGMAELKGTFKGYTEATLTSTTGKYFYSNEESNPWENGGSTENHIYYKKSIELSEEKTSLVFLIPTDGSITSVELTGEDGVETKEFKFSFDQTSVIVNLDGISQNVGTADDEVFYDSSESKLILNGYEGNLSFYKNQGNLSIEVKKSSILYSYGKDDMGKGDGSYAVRAKGITIFNPDSSKDVELSIVSNHNGYGIVDFGTLTITGIGSEVGVNVNGGYTAAYVDELSMTNAELNVTGHEKGLRVQKSTVLNDSRINASLISTESNDVGDNDYFGIKTESGIQMTKSAINTDGLRVKSGGIKLDATSVVNVYGEYTQNPCAEIKVIVAGLYLDENSQSGVVSSVDRSDNTSKAPGVHLIGDAGVFGIDVMNGDKKIETSADYGSTMQETISEVIERNEDVVSLTININTISGNDNVLEGIQNALVAAENKTLETIIIIATDSVLTLTHHICGMYGDFIFL